MLYIKDPVSQRDYMTAKFVTANRTRLIIINFTLEYDFGKEEEKKE